MGKLELTPEEVEHLLWALSAAENEFNLSDDTYKIHNSLRGKVIAYQQHGNKNNG